MLVALTSAAFGAFVLRGMPPGIGRAQLLVCFTGTFLMTSIALGSTFMKD